MKSLIVKTIFLFNLIFYQFAMGQIDSIKVFPSSPSTYDSVFFVVFSKPFGGDCTFTLNQDSIIGHNIYISGKFDSNNKCLTDGANDTINIGKFQAGAYTTYFSFIDTCGFIDTYNIILDFNVSQFTGFYNIDRKSVV